MTSAMTATSGARRAAATMRAAALLALLSLLLAGVSALTAAPAAAALATPHSPSPNAGAPGPAPQAIADGRIAIEVRAGGDRDGASNAVLPLAGAQFAAYDVGSVDADVSERTPVAWCTTDASGSCWMDLPARTGPEGSDRGYLVQAEAAPAGWTVNTRFRAGYTPWNPAPYRFHTGDSGDGAQPYLVPGPGEGPTASAGRWMFTRANPVIAPSCGLDVALLVDLSRSVANAGGTDELRAASLSFLDALTGTPSRLAVHTFAAASPSGAGNLGWQSVADPGGTGVATARAMLQGLTPSTTGGTNWDAGLRSLAPLAGDADLAIVLTDGNPTLALNPSVGDATMTRFLEIEHAIASANSVKAAGTRVVAVGIGDGTTGVPDNLQAISGHADGDQYSVAGFGEVAAILAELAGANCAGVVNVTKTEVSADGATTAPGAGWEFTARAAGPTVQLDSSTGGFDAVAAGLTSANGGIGFRSLFAGTTPESRRLTITETGRDGFTLAGARCWLGADASATVPITPRADGFEVDPVEGETVNCEVRNQRRPAEPPPTHDVGIDKVSVTAEGSVEPGETFDYTLTVTNHGTAAATGVVVTDPLPDRLRLLSVSLPEGWTQEDGATPEDLVFRAATLPVGASVGITVTVQLEPVAVEATNDTAQSPDDDLPAPLAPLGSVDLVNVADVDADLDENPDNNRDDDVLPIRELAAQVLIRCVADAPYLVFSVATTSNLASQPVTMRWFPVDAAGAPVAATPADAGLGEVDTGRTYVVPWPGAAVSPGGVSVDWPGWRPLQESDYGSDEELLPGSNVWNGLIEDDGEADHPWRERTAIVFAVNPELTITATYPPADPDCAVPMETELVVEKTASTPIVEPGDDFRYEIALRNVHDHGAAGGVVLTDEIPDDIAVTAISTSATAFPRWTGCAVAGADPAGYGGTLTCELFGPLAAGQQAPSVTLDATLRATTPDIEFVNVAVVDYHAFNDPGDVGRTTDDAIVRTEHLDDVGIDKSNALGPDGSVEAGDVFDYTITVTNHGTRTATGVVVTDELPDRLRPVAVTLPDGWINDAPGGLLTDGVLTVRTGELAVGASAVIVLTVEVLPVEVQVGSDTGTIDELPSPLLPLDDAVIRNEAVVSADADDDPSNNRDDDEVPTRDITTMALVRCVADAPYLIFSVNTTPNVTGPISMNWVPLDAEGEPVPTATPADAGLDEVQRGEVYVLPWPGAEFSQGGAAIDWPGWRPLTADDLDADGQPLPGLNVFNGLVEDVSEGDYAWRGQTRVTFQVNPETTFTAGYPPATPECVVPMATELDIEKTASVDVVAGGTAFDYTIEVTNVHDYGAAAGIVLTDEIPDTIRVTDVDAGAADAFPRWEDCAVTGADARGYGGELRCELFGPLRAGQAAPTVTLSARVAPDVGAETITNVAVVDYHTADDPTDVGRAVDDAVVRTQLAVTGGTIAWGAGAFGLLAAAAGLLLVRRRGRVRADG